MDNRKSLQKWKYKWLLNMRQVFNNTLKETQMQTTAEFYISFIKLTNIQTFGNALLVRLQKGQGWRERHFYTFLAGG